MKQICTIQNIAATHNKFAIDAHKYALGWLAPAQHDFVEIKHVF